MIVSTCDQVRINVKAVHQLTYPSNKKVQTSTGGLLSYKIGDSNIIHCYDPPHLLKGIRNNLITKNLQHHITKRWNINMSLNKQKRIASWKHIETLNDWSLKSSTNRLPKISAEHIKPKKSKMKVSLAAQIFSQTLGNMMLQCCNKRVLPKRFSDTAEILLFFNDIFDSVNGACSSGKNELKAPVTENSIHFSFWKYTLCMLEQMDFIDIKTRKKTNRTSVLRHFESTIKKFVEVCKKCFKLNITEVSLRYLILNHFVNISVSVRYLWKGVVMFKPLLQEA